MNFNLCTNIDFIRRNKNLTQPNNLKKNKINFIETVTNKKKQSHYKKLATIT